MVKAERFQLPKGAQLLSEFILHVLIRYSVKFCIIVERKMCLITRMNVRFDFHRLHTVTIKLKGLAKSQFRVVILFCYFLKAHLKHCAAFLILKYSNSTYTYTFLKKLGNVWCFFSPNKERLDQWWQRVITINRQLLSCGCT